MKKMMTACFWTCFVCIVIGAVLALLWVWKVVEGERLNQVWMTIATLFVAAALTLAIGRSYLGKDP